MSHLSNLLKVIDTFFQPVEEDEKERATTFIVRTSFTDDGIALYRVIECYWFDDWDYSEEWVQREKVRGLFGSHERALNHCAEWQDNHNKKELLT